MAPLSFRSPYQKVELNYSKKKKKTNKEEDGSRHLVLEEVVPVGCLLCSRSD